MPSQEQHPADQLYDRLHDIFGTGGNQLFAMEWPGRVLDQVTYAYEVDSIYSEMTRPQPVLEGEFRLSDGLIDVAPLVAGPNGSQLSTTYQEALNQLVPAYTGVNKSYQADKEKLRTWLLEEVSAEYVGDDGKPVTLTKIARIELYDTLNTRYLQAVASWNEQKTALLRKAQSEPNSTAALEAYAKWLAEDAPPVEAELESKFADLVVKGYYHEVRSVISSLDISLAGEALENAKASMRASAMSSLDETETVYPVQFSPEDWFKGLSTDFQPEDLLLNPEVLLQQLMQKQQQVAQLEDQITFLQSTHTGDEATLKAQVDQAQNELSSAMTALTNAFAENVLTVAKMYFGSVDLGKATEQGVDDALKAAGLGAITAEQWTKLKEGFLAVNNAQQNLTTAGRHLVELQAAEQAAKTTDSTQLIATLQSQVAALQQQIESLQSTLFSQAGTSRLQTLAKVEGDKVTYDPTKDPNAKITNGELTSYPLLPTPMPAPGEFFDVVIDFTSDSMAQKSLVEASASQTSWDVDLFFGSASGSSQSSSSMSQAEFADAKASVQIGFRAMKVTIDRGGWFDPTALGLTGEMYHLGGEPSSGEPLYTPISNGPPSSKDIPDGYKSSNADKVFAALREDAVLPAFPVAFLIVKDVTINIALSNVTTASKAASSAQSSSASGGIFCFSVSSSSSSSASSKEATSVQIANNVIIKIPGPQILGWFLEYVPKDISSLYKAMPSDFLPATTDKLSVSEPGTEMLTASPGARLGPGVAQHGDTLSEAELELALRKQVDQLLERAESASASPAAAPTAAGGPTPDGQL
jgi:hypothetical protein